MDALTATPRTPLSDWLLGPPGPARTRTVMSLISLAVFAVFAVFQHVEVLMGLIDREASNALSTYTLVGASVFVALMRADLRLPGVADPSLTALQIAFALVAVAWSYGITGPARGAVLSIMLIILLFGMFTLDARESRALGWLGFLLLSGVILHKSRTDPARYPVQVEMIHFAFAAIVALSVTVLAGRFGRLRAKLVRQKTELGTALARIQRLATHDELTGILNRRAMLEQLAAEASRMQRGAAPMCLVLVDLDHFKRINDTFGHKAGDQALQTFATLAREHLRACDVVSRWGGEEFLLMLPATAPQAAVAGVERLRQAALERPLASIHPDLVVTFSAGLACCEGVHDIEAAVERADQAMYRAKTLGRNRTEQAVEHATVRHAAP